MSRLELEALFDDCPRPTKYGSLSNELQAVASGAKAMSYFLFPGDTIEGNKIFSEILRTASELSLSVVIQPVKENGITKTPPMNNVFVTHDSESWRIPAFKVFKEIFNQYDWSDAAEHFESELLGYTEEDILNWLSDRKRSRIGWTGKTIYLLLTQQQTDIIRKCGNRYIDPSLIVDDIEIFFNRNLCPFHPNAESLLSEGQKLSRVMVDVKFFRQIFKREDLASEKKVVSTYLGRAAIERMNSFLKSDIQFFDFGSWIL